MKKSITLLELVVIVVIFIAILIVALPGIYNFINNTQKEKLISDAKRVYIETENRFKSGFNSTVVSSKDNTKLDGFNNNLNYCVILSNNGEILDLKVSDGKYLLDLSDDYLIKDVAVNDIKKGNLNYYECK